MADGDIRMEVTVAWWLDWYIHGVVWMSRLTGLEPDWEKFNATVIRTIRVRPSRG